MTEALPKQCKETCSQNDGIARIFFERENTLSVNIKTTAKVLISL